MTKKELAAALAEKQGISLFTASNAVSNILTIISEQLKGRHDVSLKDFGVFEVREQAPRVRRNVKTGETKLMDAYHKVVFRPCRSMKEGVR